MDAPTMTVTLRERARLEAEESGRLVAQAEAESQQEQRSVYIPRFVEILANDYGIAICADDIEWRGGFPRAVVQIDGVTLGIRETEERWQSEIVVARECSRGCGEPVWEEWHGGMSQLHEFLSSHSTHRWSCVEREPSPPKPDRVEGAIAQIEAAAERVADAMNRIALLEDRRALIKPMAIKRIMEAGLATSATAAEKIVETDAEYMDHRDAQRNAEREKWAALAAWEAAKLRGKLAVMLAAVASVGEDVS